MRAMASTPGLDILELGHLFFSELAAQSVHCSFWTTNSMNQENVEVVGFKFVSFALFVVKFFGLRSLSKGCDSCPLYGRTRFGIFSSFSSPAKLAAQSVHCSFLTTNSTNQTNVEVCWIKIRVIRFIRGQTLWFCRHKCFLHSDRNTRFDDAVVGWSVSFLIDDALKALVGLDALS